MIRNDQRFFICDFETTGVNTSLDFPIEVGIIITDSEFNLLETFDSLICCDVDRISLGYENWLAAYRVHGITPKMLKDAPTVLDVGSKINELAKKHTKSRKPILLSDNIQFEWGFMTHLVDEGEDWPFHYCGWDSSLFLELAGVGDPKPAHRALADAGLLHAAILKSIGGLKK